ncbi:MAG: hypothetical protein U0992_21595 [Planctomycetaceae bacterium]
MTSRSRADSAAPRHHFEPPSTDVRACSATPYLDATAWLPGIIKTGEQALGLDPLSSTGMEKSMRLALQAAVAANTVLGNSGSVHFVQDFYESALRASVADHRSWTTGVYRMAWPSEDHRYWRDRRQESEIVSGAHAEVAERLRFACEEANVNRARRSASESQFRSTQRLSAILDVPIGWAADVRIREVGCVIDSLVERRRAIHHPALDRPVAFVGGVELVRLFEGSTHLGTIRGMMEHWSECIASDTAERIAMWLVQRGLLEPQERSRAPRDPSTSC